MSKRKVGLFSAARQNIWFAFKPTNRMLHWQKVAVVFAPSIHIWRQMEIVKISSVHSLLSSNTHARLIGAHSYTLNSRQYLVTFQSWQQQRPPKMETFPVMTLEFQQIWFTAVKGKRIADAIRAGQSQVMVEDNDALSQRSERYD